MGPHSVPSDSLLWHRAGAGLRCRTRRGSVRSHLSDGLSSSKDSCPHSGHTPSRSSTSIAGSSTGGSETGAGVSTRVVFVAMGDHFYP